MPADTAQAAAITAAVSQARRLFDQGQLPQASQICRQVLGAAPEHAAAHALLGQIAFAGRNYAVAARHLETAIAGAPTNHQYRGALGAACLMQGRLDAALAAADAALAIDAGYADGKALRAETLERMGRRDEAIATVEPDVRAGTANARMILAYVRSLEAGGRYDDVVPVVEDAAADPGTPDLFRRSMLFIAGTALHERGDHDAAFAMFGRANATAPVPFDAAATERRHAELRRWFGRDARAGKPVSPNTSELPVFVIGMPRSGTTLVEQIIHAHPQAHGAGEISDVAAFTAKIPRVAGSFATYPACMADFTEAHLAQAAGILVDRLQSYAPAAARVTDKSIENVEHLGLIALLLPRARVVFVEREPIDVCFSCWIRDLDAAGHPYASDLHDVGVHYRQRAELVAYWQSQLDLAMHTIRYEDLVADAETESRRLIDFLGLPWDDACGRPHEARRDVATISYDQVRRPIYATAAGRYTAYEVHLAPLRAALAGPDAADA